MSQLRPKIRRVQPTICINLKTQNVNQNNNALKSIKRYNLTTTTATSSMV